MTEDAPRTKPVVDIEGKTRYRACTDLRGDWYVWHRLGSSDWATLRRCQTRTEAERLAIELNSEDAGVSA